MNWSAIIDRYIVEGRTVSGGKGDSTAEGTEKSQSGFSQTLQQIFQANNTAQSNQLAFLNNKIQQQIANPQGYSPSTLAAMRAQANDAVAGQTQNAERAVNAKEATEGGAGALPSGVNAQIQGQIASSAGQAENAQQQQITEANAQLQNQNLFNSEKLEQGVAGLENPEGIASAENNAAGTVSNLGNTVTNSSGPTFGSILGGVVGAGLGVAGKAIGV